MDIDGNGMVSHGEFKQTLKVAQNRPKRAPVTGFVVVTNKQNLFTHIIMY